jgi:hypothetical protein
MKTVNEIIEDQIKPKNGWIKVEDMLPERNYGDVLALFEGWDDMKFSRVLEYDNYFNQWGDWSGIVYTKVIAWQPLPKAEL